MVKKVAYPTGDKIAGATEATGKLRAGQKPGGRPEGLPTFEGGERSYTLCQ
jgi:hypothetical protein